MDERPIKEASLEVNVILPSSNVVGIAHTQSHAYVTYVTYKERER